MTTTPTFDDYNDYTHLCPLHPSLLTTPPLTATPTFEVADDGEAVAPVKVVMLSGGGFVGIHEVEVLQVAVALGLCQLLVG